jgi:hypothetical protein
LADSEKQNFWTTLPGILTGIAALLTAVTGMLLVLYPHGFRAAKESAPTTAGVEASRTAAIEGGNAAPSGAAPAQSKKPGVLVTEKDGSSTEISLRSLRDSYSGESVQLKNGQTVPFEKIKSIDFLGVTNYDQDVKVTLIDGRAIEGSIMSGEQITGDTDIGPFSISVKQLSRVVFQR